MDNREKKITELLQSPNVDLDQLRRLSWGGVPAPSRSVVWALLLGYLPTNSERRKITLNRKRKEYADIVPLNFERMDDDEFDSFERNLWRQIHIDVLRTNPQSKVFRHKVVQLSLERILYVWAMRHPATGYVQGMNDLLTPFLVVFLSDLLGCTDFDQISHETLDTIPPQSLTEVEADCYWCLTKLLDGIQDNYTFAQPGIQKTLFKMKEVVSRIDSALAAHLDKENAEYIQFAFRWVNCLLMREVPLHLVPRMWDTYFAEEDGIQNFHVYVCAAFLVHWADQLKKFDFQDIVMFLQQPPTNDWNYTNIEMLLSKGFMYKALYHNSK